MYTQMIKYHNGIACAGCSLRFHNRFELRQHQRSNFGGFRSKVFLLFCLICLDLVSFVFLVLWDHRSLIDRWVGKFEGCVYC